MRDERGQGGEGGEARERDEAKGQLSCTSPATLPNQIRSMGNSRSPPSHPRLPEPLFQIPQRNPRRRLLPSANRLPKHRESCSGFGDLHAVDLDEMEGRDVLRRLEKIEGWHEGRKREEKGGRTGSFCSSRTTLCTVAVFPVPGTPWISDGESAGGIAQAAVSSASISSL